MTKCKKVTGYKEMNRRCDKLESLGFEIHHQDSRVDVFGRAVVDFSRIKEEDFLEYAIKKVFDNGLIVGESTLQTKIKCLLAKPPTL